MGQIHHRSGRPMWIECLANWGFVSFTQNAVRHGERWPHFQVRKTIVFLQLLSFAACNPFHVPFYLKFFPRSVTERRKAIPTHTRIAHVNHKKENALKRTVLISRSFPFLLGF